MKVVSSLVAVSYCISSAIASGRCFGQSLESDPMYDTIEYAGKCVGIDHWKDLYLQTCNGGDGQEWKFNLDGTVTNKANPDLCLTSDGQWPKLRECTGSESQIWDLWSCDSPLRVGNTMETQKCLVMHPKTTSRLIAQDCDYTATVMPTFKTAECKPMYETIQGADGRCVGLDFWKDLYLYTCNANDAKQQWKFDADGTVTNKAFPDLCLEADRNWPKLRTCSKKDNQRWNFASCSNNAELYSGDGMDKCMVMLGDKRLYVDDCAQRDDVPAWRTDVAKPCKCENTSSQRMCGRMVVV